jgi:hypothetical protein
LLDEYEYLFETSKYSKILTMSLITEVRINNFKLLPELKIPTATPITLFVGSAHKNDISRALYVLTECFNIYNWRFIIDDRDNRIFNPKVVDRFYFKLLKIITVDNFKYLFKDKNKPLTIKLLFNDTSIDLTISYEKINKDKIELFIDSKIKKNKLLLCKKQNLIFINDNDEVKGKGNLIEFSSEHIEPTLLTEVNKLFPYGSLNNVLNFFEAEKNNYPFVQWREDTKPFLIEFLRTLDPDIKDIFCESNGEIYIERNQLKIPVSILDRKIVNFIKLVLELANRSNTLFCINNLEYYLPYHLISLFYNWLSLLIVKNNIQLFITTDNLDIISVFTEDEQATVCQLNSNSHKLFSPELAKRLTNNRGLDIR